MKLSKLLKSDGVGRESNFLRMLEEAEEENPIERTRESIKSIEMIVVSLRNEQRKIESMSEMKRREYLLENPNVRGISKYIKDCERALRSEKSCLKMQLEAEGVKKKNKEEWAKMLKSKRVFNPTNLPPEQINE